MERDRIDRALKTCRRELRTATAAGNRSAVHYWGLQIQDNRRQLRRHHEREIALSAVPR